MIVCIDVGKSWIRAGVYEGGPSVSRSCAIPVDVPFTDLDAVLDEIDATRGDARIEALGLSIFGPLDVDPSSTDFGRLGESSDPAWSYLNVPKRLAERFAAPVHFDVDVNAGALGEFHFGRGADVERFVYLSIGTGIGAALMTNGRPFEGAIPQVGHMLVPVLADDGFAGSCRFHGRCLQGLASGRAVLHRTGIPADALASDDPTWATIGHYLALAIANIGWHYAPERIVLGGGVTQVPTLLHHIRDRFVQVCGSFPLDAPWLKVGVDAYIVDGALSPRASLVGAGAMAAEGAGFRYVGAST